MKLLITGGAGFLGARLARTLLARGALADRTIDRIVLADLAAPADAALCDDARVELRTGDLLAMTPALRGEAFDGVFHLASAVSAECEADFDLGMRSNLDATRALLEALRAAGNAPRLVFSSSCAVYGSDPALALPAVVHDDTLPTPQTSYGIQKFIGEQLVADCTRRGFVDGRSARLMTVSVRPGAPNRAASGFLSGIVREPLAGQPVLCPVAPSTRVVLSSPARTVEGLIAIYEAGREAFGGRTALNLPALSVTVQDMLDGLRAVGGARALALVRFEPDEAIARIVQGWPARVESLRAQRLGLQPDADFESIVRQYVAEHPHATPLAR